MRSKVVKRTIHLTQGRGDSIARMSRGSARSGVGGPMTHQGPISPAGGSTGTRNPNYGCPQKNYSHGAGCSKKARRGISAINTRREQPGKEAPYIFGPSWGV